MVSRVPSTSMRFKASRIFVGSVVPASSKAWASTTTASYPSRATKVGSRPYRFSNSAHLCFRWLVRWPGRVYERNGTCTASVTPASGRPDVSSNRSASGLPSTPPESLSCFTAKAIPSWSSRPAQGMPGNDKGPRPPIRIIFFVSISLPSYPVLRLISFKALETEPIRTDFAPTDVGQEASSPLHVPPIGVTKSGKQDFFFLSRSDHDEDEEERAACKDEPVGGRERVGSYAQGERHIEGVADPAIRAGCHQGVLPPRDHRVRQVLPQAAEGPDEQCSGNDAHTHSRPPERCWQGHRGPHHPRRIDHVGNESQHANDADRS